MEKLFSLFLIAIALYIIYLVAKTRFNLHRTKTEKIVVTDTGAGKSGLAAANRLLQRSQEIEQIDNLKLRTVSWDKWRKDRNQYLEEAKFSDVTENENQSNKVVSIK